MMPKAGRFSFPCLGADCVARLEQFTFRRDSAAQRHVAGDERIRAGMEIDNAA